MNDATQVGQVPTIAEASRLIESKALSPVELTELLLKRIEALDPKLNSFLLVTEKLARKSAKKAEAEIMAGRRRGPLHGIPIGLKDIYCTKRIRTTAHSKVLEDYVPTEDSTVTTKLAKAGTTLLGKLATHEFAIGGPSFDTPWPPARNPWDPELSPGGSSSGSGAAIAAGLVLGATGSDTGGSIRSPSTFCAVAGMKPSYGLVSRYGILPLAFTLDHAGPMAWTVEDCAILLQAMAGHDKKDAASAKVKIPDYRAALRQDLKGVRVGYIRHWHEGEFPVEPEMARAVEAAADTMKKLGADVRDVAMPALNDFAPAGRVIILSETFAVHAKNLQTRYNDYGERFRSSVTLAALFSANDYVQAMRSRQQLIERTRAAMAGFDVMICAAAPGAATKMVGYDRDGAFKRPSLTMPFNLTGLPVMTVCCGFTAAGLPLGVQVVGHPFGDATAMGVAHAYERATSWRAKRPPMAA
ncbi:MAG: amidase [Alphaproteobacteria bacterium]|nr:amidase [Alphaproteobacteria bacterium]